jgi:hypothetical protein
MSAITWTTSTCPFRLVGRTLYRVDPQLGVGVHKEAGEVRNAAGSAHALDQLLGPQIGRVAGVRAQAKGVVGWLLEAARERDDLRALAGQLAHHRVGADRIAGEDQEAVVALGQQALESWFCWLNSQACGTR